MFISIIFSIIGLFVVFFVISKLFQKKNNKSNVTASFTPPQNQGLRGKTKEQKMVIRYFGSMSLSDIFLGSITLGVWFIIFYLRKISNATFDSLLNSKADELALRVEERALKVHGMDATEVNEIPPILAEGYYSGSLYFKICKDLTFRASEYQMTYLMFSDKQMYAYSYIFDLTSADTAETTKEYFYEDITNVEATKIQIDFPAPRPSEYIIGGIACIIIGILMMILSLKSVYLLFLGFPILVVGVIVTAFLGYARHVVDNLVLKLTVPGDNFVCAMSLDNMEAIQGMKAKIREKKE